MGASKKVVTDAIKEVVRTLEARKAKPEPPPRPRKPTVLAKLRAQAAKAPSVKPLMILGLPVVCPGVVPGIFCGKHVPAEGTGSKIRLCSRCATKKNLVACASKVRKSDFVAPPVVLDLRKGAKVAPRIAKPPAVKVPLVSLYDPFACREKGDRYVKDCLDDFVDADCHEIKGSPCWKCAKGLSLRKRFAADGGGR